ncbi:uncharacterized protein LOC108865268 [Galendromus occidentalis]|uniref:Uncharacterized protein LOC108865268 n=1 Tax=Galendromus occidentalis TaxID=34638 RepID=A0AAJ7L8P2_9ACAR|nr:uncharacterized protein LOC108865268 [Galendromus occidentalis]
MPRHAAEPAEKVQRYAGELGSGYLTADGDVLFCEACKMTVNADKRYYVGQHVQSVGHVRRHQLAQISSEEGGLASDLSPRENSFSMDLCRMMVESNIKLYKNQQQSFRTFMQKQCQADPPNHTTLRKTYLKKLYEGTVYKLRSSIGDNRICISIDETADVKGQFVVNTVIGVLNPETPSIPFLLNSDTVGRTHQTTVAQAFTNALNLLWPDRVHHERVLLFVTD